MKPVVGQPLNRVDGLAKVTGTATYAAEFPAEGLLHAVMVLSTVARGRLTGLDVAEASAAPGVATVLTHKNAPRLAVDPKQKQVPQDRVVQVLQGPEVLYQHQPIALVLADTLERATHAAALVRARYAAEKASADFDAEKKHPEQPPPIFGEPTDQEHGSLAQGLSEAEVKVEATYATPFEHHNPLEPHATLAQWDDPRHLTVHDATQGVFNERRRLAALFGLPPENVRVICKFVGGGFGCKDSTWSHQVLAALAAKATGRPVRLVLQRPQMFGPVGFRPRTEQRLVLGAKRDGALTALSHASANATSRFDTFTEPCAMVTRVLYACPNLQTSHRLVRLSTGTPTFMRAPGEASGSFALESALDELAVALQLDPVALRLKNETDREPVSGKPYSSRSLRACYQAGAEAFGWARRDPKVGAMRDGRMLLGWGMAAACCPTRRSEAEATARLLPDGSAEVLSGSQDLGAGTATRMTQRAADALGLPVEKVRFDPGDTRLPETPVSGGSQTAASLGSAVDLACRALRQKAAALAAGDAASPLHGADPAQVEVEAGRLFRKDQPRTGEAYAELLARQKLAALEAQGSAAPGAEAEQYAMHSFGAHFVEVRVDPELGEVRVSRAVGAFGVGQVPNAKTARSQLLGGMTFGIGMALLEHTALDARTGRFVTRDLADYHLPVSRDVPELQVLFVPEEDPHVNEVGAKGIGELGITGMAAAVANAVYHATGKRVRDLPITLDKLL